MSLTSLATDAGPLGPSGSQMEEIAKLTIPYYPKLGESNTADVVLELLVMRLTDNPKNWQVILKVLIVIDYCLHRGGYSFQYFARKRLEFFENMTESRKRGGFLPVGVRLLATEICILLDPILTAQLDLETRNPTLWKGRVDPNNHEMPDINEVYQTITLVYGDQSDTPESLDTFEIGPQPSMDTVAQTDVEGRFSQPKGKQYSISTPYAQPEPIEHGVGQPSTQRVQSVHKYEQALESTACNDARQLDRSRHKPVLPSLPNQILKLESPPHETHSTAAVKSMKVVDNRSQQVRDTNIDRRSSTPSLPAPFTPGIPQLVDAFSAFNSSVLQVNTPLAPPTLSSVSAGKVTLQQSLSDRLGSYFLEGRLTSKLYTDADIHDISMLLKQFDPRWSKVPRTYIVLRSIGSLDLLDRCIELGFSDYWFPVTERILPDFLRPSVRAAIVEAQDLILTKSLDLEKGDRGQHCYFRKGEPLPFEMKGILGSGGYGQGA
jgi:hypothetical protein